MYVRWGLAVLVVSVGVGLASGVVLYRTVIEPSADERGVSAHQDDSLLWRALLLDARTVRVYLGGVAVIGVWAVVDLAGLGPESLAALLSFVVLPFGLPLLLVAPLAIGSHVVVIVGYGACAFWLALLARLFVERVAAVDEPGGGSYRSTAEAGGVED